MYDPQKKLGSRKAFTSDSVKYTSRRSDCHVHNHFRLCPIGIAVLSITGAGALLLHLIIEVSILFEFEGQSIKLHQFLEPIFSSVRRYIQQIENK